MSLLLLNPSLRPPYPSPPSSPWLLISPYSISLPFLSPSLHLTVPLLSVHLPPSLFPSLSLLYFPPSSSSTSLPLVQSLSLCHCPPSLTPSTYIFVLDPTPPLSLLLDPSLRPSLPLPYTLPSFSFNLSVPLSYFPPLLTPTFPTLLRTRLPSPSPFPSLYPHYSLPSPYLHLTLPPPYLYPPQSLHLLSTSFSFSFLPLPSLPSHSLLSTCTDSYFPPHSPPPPYSHPHTQTLEKVGLIP